MEKLNKIYDNAVFIIKIMMIQVMCLLRIMLIIVPKSLDEYSAPSVGIHIFGYVPTGVRPKLDGVRSDCFPYLELHVFLFLSSIEFLLCLLNFATSLETGLLSVSSSQGWRWMG